MSKSIYLDDPDGINVEFTLETPERFKRVITARGIQMEDTNGTIRSAADRLDLNEVMLKLENKDVNRTISNKTYMGHIHIYANDVQQSNAFYKKMEFIPFNDLPQFKYADLGAGGAYKHRIALNSWHGTNRPLAPANSAGMRHYHLIYNSKDKLQRALDKVGNYEARDGGYWITDPTGNTVLLTHT